MKRLFRQVSLALLLALVFSLVMAVPVLADALTNVTDTLGSYAAGATTTHTVGFTFPSNLNIYDRIVITFPSDFNIASATLGSVTGLDGAFTLPCWASLEVGLQPLAVHDEDVSPDMDHLVRYMLKAVRH